MRRLSRRRVLGSVVGAVGTVAGCVGGPAGDADGEKNERGPPTTDRTLPEAHTTAGLEDNILSGGPGKDGIPSIDDPVFNPVDAPPSALDGDDPVFGVELNGDARAYPQSILVWHEVVNDTIGDESVAVTYCPLTGTAQGFFRGSVEFGVSGQLLNSNLVMYDRATDGYWSQVLARGVTGPHEGEYLEEFPVTWTTWDRWRSTHRDTMVLTEETGFARDYGRDPYGSYNPTDGYYADENTLFPPLTTDDSLHPKAVVIGARTEDGAVAVPKEELRERDVVEGSVGSVPYVSVYDADLDTGYVYRNPDPVEVSVRGGDIVVDGESYAPDALPLDRRLGFDAMWFAWYGFYPSTVVHP